MTKHELVFTRNGILIRELVQFPIKGELWVTEQTSYEDFGKGGEVDLRVKRIETSFDNGTLKEIKLVLSEVGLVISKGEGIPEAHSGTEDLYRKSMEKLKKGDYPHHYKPYTRQCFREGTMANVTWNLIEEVGEIKFGELKKKIREKGYNTEGGSLSASIMVLKRILNVIEDRGRGDNNRKFRYIGPNKI